MDTYYQSVFINNVKKLVLYDSYYWALRFLYIKYSSTHGELCLILIFL